MLEKIPSQSDLTQLLGPSLFEVWQNLCSVIDKAYDMERVWNTGGKKWTYEYKYRRGGKTLCCLYAKDSCLGFMVILGKDERANLKKYDPPFPPPSAGNMTRRTPTTTGNGSCLSRPTLPNLMTI